MACNCILVCACEYTNWVKAIPFVNHEVGSIADIICRNLTGIGDKWPLFVFPSCWAMNTQVSKVTGFSPFEMVYHCEPPDLFHFNDLVQIMYTKNMKLIIIFFDKVVWLQTMTLPKNMFYIFVSFLQNIHSWLTQQNTFTPIFKYVIYI